MAVVGWRVFYADGSSFGHTDGSWAQAPPFGVQCVVYYDTQGRVTVDTASRDDSTYIWRGDGDEAGIKVGLWMDTDGHYRIVDAAGRSRP